MSPDVIVIGGGVIGTAATFALSKRGARVTMLERNAIAGGATGASAGMLMPQGGPDTMPEFASLLAESMRLFPALAAELKERTGADIGYRPVELLELALDEAVELQLRRECERGSRQRWLDAAATLAIEPAANPALRGAAYRGTDAQVLPLALAQALARGAAGLGATIREGVTVDRLELGAGRVQGVVVGGESMAAGEVVIANGTWAAAWSHPLGVSIPVRPIRGQMIALGNGPGRELHAVLSGFGGYVVPKPDGRILVGTTVEEVGFDARATVEGITSLLELAPRLSPGLEEATVLSAWAGLRPATPDGLPILGRIPGWDGVTIATGHFRNGILLAPITAELVADLVFSGRPRLQLDRFDPTRFLVHAA